MRKDLHTHLSRRERQIMDILYERENASALDIQNSLPNPPSYSAVRAMLSKLEKKEVISHKEQGAKYIYYPNTEKQEAQQSALARLLQTFFDGSPVAAVNTLLSKSQDNLSTEDLDELELLIREARERAEKKEHGTR